MPILIDQMDVQPAATASAAKPARDDAGASPPPSERRKQADLLRALRIAHERRARLRAY